MDFKPATREASAARIALSGPSGSGKTYTALVLATALSDNVGVIDTERGSASKYVGLNGWQFETVTPDKFSPLSLVEILGVAAGRGFGALVLDSFSHYWMGVDGMLEQADRRAIGNNSFSGWKEVRPEERRMIDALVAYPGHVVVTMRSKTEYVVEENERGKKVPRKVGLKPEQREGIEYEFDLVGDMDLDNTLTVVKSRIHTLSKAVIPLPGEELALQVRDWLSDGEKVPTVSEYRKRALAIDSPESLDDLRALYEEVCGHRMAAAPTVDAEGNPTVLGDLIKAHGFAVKNAPPKPKVQQPVEQPSADGTRPDGDDNEQMLDDTCAVLNLDLATVKGRFTAEHQKPPRLAEAGVVQAFCDRLCEEVAKADKAVS